MNSKVKKQIDQPKTAGVKWQKPADWVRYEVYFSFRESPLTEKHFSKIAQELIAWSETHKEAKRFRDFLRPRGISGDTWARWVEQSDELKKAFKWAMEAIGDNREDLMCEHKLPEKAFQFVQHIYDQAYIDAHKFYADLKKETEEKQQVLNIYVPSLIGETKEYKKIEHEEKP